MFSRRHFLKMGLVTSAGLFIPWRWPIPRVNQASPKLEKFIDPVPIPAALKPVKTVDGVAQYEISLSQFDQQLHSQLSPTTVWGYNGTFPGPTIEARTKQPLKITWKNDLPAKHLLPVDSTLHGAEGQQPEVRAVVHLHGGHVPPESDGYPTHSLEVGKPMTIDYPNAQEATTLWYHDHAVGITRLNVYAGLAGLYLIRDEVEDQLNLPKDAYEIPLVIQDRSFTEQGKLFYPDKGDTHPVWVPEFLGDTILVNGKVWPYLEVEPRKYRFRFLNGSNARFYRLTLTSGQPFHQIGSEGGLLEAPVTLNQIVLSPAERADVILDFSKFEGQTITLQNDAPSPFPNGDPVEAGLTDQIMQFKVTRPLAGKDTSVLPDKLRPVPRFKAEDAVLTRTLSLDERLDANDNPVELTLNGLDWDDPVTEQIRFGTVEVWELVNTTEDAHPIHLHLVMFQVLNRQPFDKEKYERGKPVPFTGPAVAPAANEMGWKDTVRADPGEVTRIIARFADYAGRYVWHCHILEHEDNSMMRPFEVVKA